jgi:U3 small nucleolar RNA-associated protein MPP10
LFNRNLFNIKLCKRLMRAEIRLSCARPRQCQSANHGKNNGSEIVTILLLFSTTQSQSTMTRKKTITNTAATTTTTKTSKSRNNTASPQQSDNKRGKITKSLSKTKANQGIVGSAADYLSNLVDNPELFVSQDRSLSSQLQSQVKSLYDYTKSLETPAVQLISSQFDCFPSLLTEGFNSEQIWEQLQLQNQSIFQLTKQFSLSASSEDGENDEERKELSSEEEEEEEDEDEDEEQQQQIMDDEELEAKLAQDEHDEDEDENGEASASEEQEELDMDEDEVEEASEHSPDNTAKPSKQPSKSGAPISEDAFFSFAEMEAFADEFDAPLNSQYDEGVEPSSEVDLDAETGDIQLGKGEKYTEFFDAPSSGQLLGQTVSEGMKEEEESEEFEGQNDDEWGGLFAQQRQLKRQREVAERAAVDNKLAEKFLSSYEKQQKSSGELISALESKIIQPREWYLQGEKSARDRPADSLLDVELDYNRATREKQEITQEYTEKLEELIKRRIINAEFNDPVRKLALEEPEFHYREELSSNKAELGLAEQYAEQYSEKLDVAEGKKTKLEEQKNKEHAEISLLWGNLCYQLDSLANYQFTPKPARIEINVVSNSTAKSIEMEEIQPSAASAAQLSAPRQQYSASVSTGQVIGQNETSREEKKRRRRTKKSAYKKQKLAVEERNREKMGQLPQNLNKIGLEKKALASDVQRAMTDKNVKEGGVRDNINYNKSSEFFNVLAEVQKDADREEKVNKATSRRNPKPAGNNKP